MIYIYQTKNSPQKSNCCGRFGSISSQKSSETELEVCCEEAEPPKLVELLFWLFVLSDSGKLNFIIYLGYSEINFSMDHGESTQFENSYILFGDGSRALGNGFEFSFSCFGLTGFFAFAILALSA